MKLNMAEEIQVVPVLTPADIVATAAVTKYVNLSKVGMGQLEFEINFGAVASTDSTGEVVVTIEANDVNDTSTSDNNEGAIAFKYRLSGAIGTDTMGAMTDAEAAGTAVNNTNDNKTLLVYVDPAVAAKKYVRAVITPTAEISSTLVGAVARFIPRKAQSVHPSSS
jgi:hypothetical protein